MVLVNFNMGYLVFFMVSVVDVIVNLVIDVYWVWSYYVCLLIFICMVLLGFF